MNGVDGLTALDRTVEKEKKDAITLTVLKTLLIEQKYKCALTGWALTPENASLDHITPLSRQGTNTVENIQIIHGDVNRAKGVMTNDEFVRMCNAVTSKKNTEKP